jgi:hypothetical protein
MRKPKSDLKAPLKPPARKQMPRPKTAAAKPAPSTKLGAMIALLQTSKGATISDLVSKTGWQAHSVRGALAGALKKKGFAVTSEKEAGERYYRLTL